MTRVRWENERPGVFAGHLGDRIVGRVVGELKEWEWAAYRRGITHDCGKTASFADACAAVEALAQEYINEIVRRLA
jgi:hypothetical protein